MKKQQDYPKPKAFADLMLLKGQNIQLLRKRYPLDIATLGAMIVCVPILIRGLFPQLFSFAAVEDELDTDSALYQGYVDFFSQIEEYLTAYLAHFPKAKQIAPSSFLEAFNFLFKVAEEGKITHQTWTDIISSFLCNAKIIQSIQNSRLF